MSYSPLLNAISSWVFLISVAAASPNIVFIVADDLGWNDVSFHGSNQIPTPNIDALAYNGIILNNHYVQPVCTPSRAALLTGKYPIRLGLQGSPLLPAEKRSLPEEKLLPDYLKELGYDTHLIGKWHMGYSKWNDTPTFRGFDHFFGYYNGWVSYYDYLNTARIGETVYTGFDLRDETEPAWGHVGEYATDVFTNRAIDTIQKHDATKPLFLMLTHLAVHAGNDGKLLEAPQETINKFKYIIDSNRRTYAAMVSKLDDSVGAIVQALDQKQMLANSIIVFLSDNGAPTVATFFRNWGSNYPLRGVKETLYEGAVRGVACLWSPLLVQNARVSNQLMHVTDWLPTLLQAAGGTLPFEAEIDGVDLWSSLSYGFASPRDDILVNIDERTKSAGIRYNDWKLLVGTTHNGSFDGYFGESGRNNIRTVVYNTSKVFNSPAAEAIRKASYTVVSETEFEDLRRIATVRCASDKSQKNSCDLAAGDTCLFDLRNDPCEENNLAALYPSVVRRLKRAIVEYRKGLVPQLDPESDIERADPKLFQYTWNPWIDCLDDRCTA